MEESSFTPWFWQPPCNLLLTLSLLSFDNLLLQTVAKTSTAAASNNKKALTAKEKASKYEELKGKRAWDTAVAPAKQLPMQLMMVYFSGGGVQIFSIGMVAMLLSAPFRAFSGINDGPCFQSHRTVGIYTVDSLRTVRTLKCEQPTFFRHPICTEDRIHPLQLLGTTGGCLEMSSDGSTAGGHR